MSFKTQTAYTPATDSARFAETKPISLEVIDESLVDTTDVAAATNYYPSSSGLLMLGFGDISVTGKFIDADGTVTLSAEVTNDEIPATADWVTVYAWDDKNNVNANSWTVTNGTLTFAISFNNCNFRYVRFVVVNSGATNTIILKIRRKAL